MNLTVPHCRKCHLDLLVPEEFDKRLCLSCQGRKEEYNIVNRYYEEKLMSLFTKKSASEIKK